MTETTQSRPPDTVWGGWSVRRVLMAILAFQIGMAVVLGGSDLLGSLPRLFPGERAPALDAPVAPGDQVRRFRPGDLPGRVVTGDPDRQVRLPDPGDMPTRLRFSVEDEAGGAAGDAAGDAARVALMTGQIAPGDSLRFTDWLDRNRDTDGDAAGDPAFGTVRLHSPGGSVQDALAIGRVLREAGIGTVMEAGDICLSACPYMLAAGVARAVDAEAMVGVHQHYFGENTALPAFMAVSDIQRGQADVMAYLDEMGIDVRVMQHGLSTPPESIYVLLPEELEEYRMVFAEEAEASD